MSELFLTVSSTIQNQNVWIKSSFELIRINIHFLTNNYGFSRSSLFFSVPGFQWSWMVCIYGPPKFRPIKIRRSTRRKSTSISECSRTEFWQTIIRNHILLRKKSKILRTFRRKLSTGACSKSIFSEINKSRIWAESFRNIFDQNMVRKNHNVTWSIFIKSGSSRTDDSSTSKIDTAALFSDNPRLAVNYRKTRDTRTESSWSGRFVNRFQDLVQNGSRLKEIEILENELGTVFYSMFQFEFPFGNPSCLGFCIFGDKNPRNPCIYHL